MLRGKNIVLGVTGGIAAYKSCYLVRELRRAGADVKVIMTGAASRFVTPLTFSTLSGHPVAADLWSSDQSTTSEIGTRHIDLASWADVLVIAPASANTIAKLTQGISDNVLTVVTLACTRPVVLAPTMDADMYLNRITQENLSRLRERGFFLIPTERGEHASGLKGPGRFPEVEPIVRFIDGVVNRSYEDLKKIRLLVTAGPTYEAIDPVRFVGNRSSGKMGFAIATAAAQRGARVTLVAGPVRLETPKNVRRVDVESAGQMARAVLSHAKNSDVAIMAAAVADFAPRGPKSRKIKKLFVGQNMQIELAATRDILGELGRRKGRKVLVGFALETDHGLANAKAKLKSKNLDLVVLNTLGKRRKVFGAETNSVTILDRKGKVERVPELPKYEIAHRILDRVKKLR